MSSVEPEMKQIQSIEAGELTLLLDSPSAIWQWLDA